MNQDTQTQVCHKKLSSRPCDVGYYLATAIVGLGCMVGALMLLPEVAEAAFDLDKGVKAATDPLIKGVTDHWGKGVLLSGAGFALFGEGDARQRALRAAIGCASAGAVVLGLIATLT